MADTLNSLQIMNYRAPYPGNFIRSMLALEDVLTKNQATCVLAFPASAKPLYWIQQLQRQGKKVFFFSGRVLKDARLFASLMRRYQIRIVHTHFASSQTHLAALLARLTRPGAVSIVHVHNHEKRKSTLQNWLKRSIVNAHLYIGVSKDVSEDMIALGYSPQKCVHIPNAVDFSRLDSFDAVCAKPAVRSGQKKILMFGFDFERKGVDVAVGALHRYDRERSMVLMIVLARNAEAVTARIENMLGQIPDWIRLLPPRDDVAAYYRMADVFLSPSREEGLPYALIEAAYCGVRIIASDISGQRSVGIPHMLQFRSEDSRALYEALKTVVACRDSGALINEARTYVTSQFRLENWAEEVLRAYRSVDPTKPRERLSSPVAAG